MSEYFIYLWVAIGLIGLGFGLGLIFDDHFQADDDDDEGGDELRKTS